MVFSPVFAILAGVGLAGAVYVNLLLVLGHFVIVRAQSSSESGCKHGLIALHASAVSCVAGVARGAQLTPPVGAVLARCSGVLLLASRTVWSSTLRWVLLCGAPDGARGVAERTVPHMLPVGRWRGSFTTTTAIACCWLAGEWRPPPGAVDALADTGATQPRMDLC